MTDEEKIKLENKIAFLENTVTIMQQRLKSLGKKYSEDLEKVNGELLKILQLQKENAALRERLDKAVEFPFENLDKVFILAGEDTKTKQFIPDRIVEGTIVGFGYDVYEWVDGNYKFNYYILVGENNYIFALEQFNKTLFKTRKAAETRLAELKGGRE